MLIWRDDAVALLSAVPPLSELLQCLLGGMQSHLDSSVVRIRRMGMVVGECLSSRMDLSQTKLQFEVRSRVLVASCDACELSLARV